MEHVELEGRWLGADGVFSVQCPNSTRSIWTFQDSIVSDLDEPQRHEGIAWLSNTVAITEGDMDNFRILNYYWQMIDERAESYFHAYNILEPWQKYWPNQPFFINDVLYVTMACIDVTGISTWENNGTHLARVKNWQDDPRNWVVNYTKVFQDGPNLGTGTFVDEDGGFLYLWAPVWGTQCLTRIPLEEIVNENIDHFGYTLAYLDKDGNWYEGLDEDECATQGFNASSGQTVRYVPGHDMYVALFSLTNTYPSLGAAVSTSRTLEGPWSEPVMVYPYPDYKTKEYIYCYAAYEHIQFNPDLQNSILFAYTCNAGVPDMLEDEDIYKPIMTYVADVKWPEPPERPKL